MSRLLKIALREYLAYVRTLGFWLSLCLTPLGLVLAFGGPAMLAQSAPPPRLAVIDLTGQGYAAAIAEALRTPRLGRQGASSAPPAVLVPNPIGAVDNPRAAGLRLKPFFERTPRPAGASLDAAAVVHADHGTVAVDFWTRNLADRSLEDLVRDAVAGRMSAARLAALGVSERDIAAVDAMAPRLTDYSAEAGAKAGLRDRLPGLVGFGLGMLLWMMIFTGAGILLNSVIEEKSSRILEVLMASASAGEIMGGKILGVAGVTATVLTAWATVGGAILVSSSPHLAHELAAVLIGRGLAVYFAVYLVGGYLMYAALFTAVGAHCETTREAQTLLAPAMMISTIPVVFMSQAILRPDAPALMALSWIPPFTPFLAPARAASNPPLWQMLATMAETALAAAASLYISARAFRSGALSTGRSDGRSLFMRVFRPSAD